MDEEEFRSRGEEIVDYIADFIKSVGQRRVYPTVAPGYLTSRLPASAPEKGEPFEKIMKDIETHIMPGITHWQHPRFHAYFPCGFSYPAILGEMINDAIGCVSFDWNISPAGSELEAIVTDWLGKIMGLPDQFLKYAPHSKGGGVVQNSSSECILISMLTARNDCLKKEEKNPSQNKALTSMVAYCSNESHSCVEKAAMIAMVTIRVLETDSDFRLRGETLDRAVKEDKKNGLIPFYVSITLGTTSCCACDPIDEIGAVCAANDMWLNVDAAYGGAALICPEFQHLLKGVEYVSSFNVNPAKWLLIGLDSAVMYVTNCSKINDSVVVDKSMLNYGSAENDWGNPSSRRFRSLRHWFVMRVYGVKGLQAYIRNHVHLAQLFAECVKGDARFELLTCNFGLVCFRLKGSNTMNKKLLMCINLSAKIHIIACILYGRYVLRFCLCYEKATEQDITYAWSVIQEFASEILRIEMLRYSDTAISYQNSVDNMFS